MNATFWRHGGRLWCQGLLLCSLRFAQMRTGFDPDTGLAVPNVPGTMLLVLLGFCVLVELVQCLRTPKGEGIRFHRPGDAPTMAAVIGGLLLAAGGLLLLLAAVPAMELSEAVTGVLAAVSGAGVLLTVRQMRAGGELSVSPLLPVLFFGVFLVLEVYLPFSSDPVLIRFYIPLLAAAALAYAFSHLAGVLRGDGSSRAFVLTADVAVLLCLTALADGVPARMLVYGGAALVLTVFLLVREAVPPEEAPELAEEA